MESRKTYNFEFSDFYFLWLELWVKLGVSEIDEVNLATVGHLASFFRQCTLTIRIYLLILENLFLPGCPFPSPLKNQEKSRYPDSRDEFVESS